MSNNPAESPGSKAVATEEAMPIVEGGGATPAVAVADPQDRATISTNIKNASSASAAAIAKKKRMCRFPGCNRVIKSQGHCQRHGAKAKRCRVAGCDKQAQGTHDGMCKRHWKQVNFPDDDSTKAAKEEPPPPEGESVYEQILPQSIQYRPPPVVLTSSTISKNTTAAAAAAAATKKVADDAADAVADPWDAPPPPEGAIVMPLVKYLRGNAHKKAGWHRNQERRARGVFPVTSVSCQLEPWERQLALVEILLLSGGTPYANFKDLAHAWGREKGFHNVLATAVCERRGEVERKRRSDAGKVFSEGKRAEFKAKLKKARTASAKNDAGKAALEPPSSGAEDEEEGEEKKESATQFANV